ncbi:MAG TPA: YceD family protein [Clostridia bacterium]|nr:YceD family protein [Clostridia bacterium]
MIIHVNRLRRGDDGRMTFTLKEYMEGLDYGGERLDFESPVVVNGSIERDGELLYVTGEVRAEVVLQCSRCLGTVRHPLRTGFSQQYSEAGPGEEVLPVKGDSIDLREPVVESILLELPVKVLCSEECKGLCPICGADRNVKECGCSFHESDPRMQQLKRLLEQ